MTYKSDDSLEVPQQMIAIQNDLFFPLVIANFVPIKSGRQGGACSVPVCQISRPSVISATVFEK